jgi:tRNA threonylcarbamoyladenosine biosynthesis protein TsaE
MSEYLLPVADEQAMVDFGRRLAALLRPGMSLYLRGDLGAGKTTLTRGVLRALGHEGAVKSPTYTLVEPYLDLPVPVYHFDLYRLGDPQEVEFMGIRDYFDAAALLVLEWPERGAAWLPDPDLDLHIGVQGAGREVRLAGCSDAGKAVVDALRGPAA